MSVDTDNTLRHKYNVLLLCIAIILWRVYFLIIAMLLWSNTIITYQLVYIIIIADFVCVCVCVCVCVRAC